MQTDPRTNEAIDLMLAFVTRTGAASDAPQQRYLWTDAFAVCNLLGLARATGESGYAQLALQLVDSVHHTLGRHREDAPHGGWISGLGEDEGESHPTRGGLRIGKKLPERGPGQPIDERTEWDRDGQYFHYLTKWMHALDQVTRSTGEARFNLWARELAAVAHRAFTYGPLTGGRRRMYWKMSIDLARPLVASMGHHDPLDAYITYGQLRSTAAGLSAHTRGPRLDDESSQCAAMVEGGEWATADPLGLGGLLVDAYRIEQLVRQGAALDGHLLEALLAASLAGLRAYLRGGELQRPAEARLGFRELGLAIGLQALGLLRATVDADARSSFRGARTRARLEPLLPFVPHGADIESFWRQPDHRRARTWSEHRDINEVMLATCLAPDGFLVLPPPRGALAGNPPPDVA